MSMPTIVIPPGSLVFVTGVNGLIGSHVVDQLLARGYQVRGAVRDVEKSSWLTAFFAEKHPSTQFSLVSVPDMTVEGCYDDVVKGTDGVIHIASPLSGQDPSIAVPIAVNGALNALKAAAKCSSIKRFVYTSSSMSATFPKPGVKFEINDKSWNEEGIQKGWNYPEDMPLEKKGLCVYAALKTEGEKACWKWMEENKPHFKFNSILPNANFSKVLVPEKQGYPSTIDWVRRAYTGEYFSLMRTLLEPQYFVSTQDTALIHIGALIYGDINNERLLAFAEPFSWNGILNVLRKLYPERSFDENVENEDLDLSTVRNERAEEVLRRVKGVAEGTRAWDGLEEKVRETAELWG